MREIRGKKRIDSQKSCEEGDGSEFCGKQALCLRKFRDEFFLAQRGLIERLLSVGRKAFCRALRASKTERDMVSVMQTASLRVIVLPSLRLATVAKPHCAGKSA